jgi:hypothetical protein
MAAEPSAPVLREILKRYSYTADTTAIADWPRFEADILAWHEARCREREAAERKRCSAIAWRCRTGEIDTKRLTQLIDAEVPR